MRPIALVCALLFLTLPAVAGDYTGSDGGYLVYSAGGIESGAMITLHFKRVATPDGTSVSDKQGAIGCRCVGVWSGKMSNPDYEGHETGKVFVRRLPPGRYEIYNYLFSGSGPGAVETSSKNKFAIPFEIRPGDATYIGNIAWGHSLGTRLEKTHGFTGYFVISDKSDRDLPIARRKQPNLPETRNEVFDVSTLDHPMFFATEPDL